MRPGALVLAQCRSFSRSPKSARPCPAPPRTASAEPFRPTRWLAVFSGGSLEARRGGVDPGAKGWIVDTSSCIYVPVGVVVFDPDEFAPDNFSVGTSSVTLTYTQNLCSSGPLARFVSQRVSYAHAISIPHFCPPVVCDFCVVAWSGSRPPPMLRPPPPDGLELWATIRAFEPPHSSFFSKLRPVLR